MSQMGILVFLTYAMKGSHALRMCRAVRDAGLDVSVAYYVAAEGAYAEDALEDFRVSERILDLTRRPPRSFLQEVQNFIERNGVGLLIQVGCEPMYPYLAELRERHKDLKLLDVLYNEVGHTVSHFLFENAFDAVVVESDYMAKRVVDHSEKSAPRVHVVENGVDIDRFAFSSRPRSDRRLVVGYVGRMSPEKNPAGFVALAKALIASTDGLEFRLFGEGPLLSQIKDAICDTRSNRITYEGFRERVEVALDEIDVLVVPSLLDGRPNIIMEANAAGVPVIAAPVGGIPEMIDDGVNGYVSRPDEVGRLRSLFESWLASPQTLTELSIGARHVAVTRFSAQRMVDGYKRTFASYLS